MRGSAALLGICILSVAFFLTSCASTNTVTSISRVDPTYHSIISKIDELCSRLEGERISEPEDIKKTVHGSHINYSLVSFVSVSGEPPRSYRFNFNNDLRVVSFVPDDGLLRNTSIGTDT